MSKAASIVALFLSESRTSHENLCGLDSLSRLHRSASIVLETDQIRIECLVDLGSLS